jgi:hypothetical protein
MTRGAIAEPLSIAFANGATTSNEFGEPYKIEFPTEVLTNDRANRFLPDVKFEVVYSNAIHSVAIRGNITL